MEESMPLFEFECQGCGAVFEVRAASHHAITPIECPSCGSKEAERLWSPFSTPTGGGGGCGETVSGVG
jgi:putative FmdB family regulatory protein